MKNPKYPIGNRIRDLPACSAMPQPTALSPTILLRGSNRHYSSITVFLPEHTSRSSTLLRFWPLEDLARLKNKQFLIPDTFRLCLNHIRKTIYVASGSQNYCEYGMWRFRSHELSNAGGIAGPSCLRRSRGYSWAILPPEVINTETCSSRLGVGRGADNLSQ